MADMGLPGYWQDATTLDVERLMAQFDELKGQSAGLRQALMSRAEERTRRVNEQFRELSALISSGRKRSDCRPTSESSSIADGEMLARGKVEAGSGAR
jgi:hypothetical protein